MIDTAPSSPGLADDPLIPLECPACRGALAAERALAGKAGRCPLCRSGFTVPQPPRRTAAGRPAAEAPDAVQMHRASREEKSRRRARRNIVMLFAGVFILLAIVLSLGTRRPTKRR